MAEIYENPILSIFIIPGMDSILHLPFVYMHFSSFQLKLKQCK